MGVLNTALYYTKVCLGFSFKHEKVDIPFIPKGATNGDILKMMFPQMKVEKMGTLVELVENGVPKIGLNDDFWDARYTEGFPRKELEK